MEKQLTQAMQNFVDLDKRFNSEIKPFLDAYKAATELLACEIGVDGHFQDPDGIVYQAIEPAGRFVAFDRYRIARTRREGERAGELSLTAARALGYVVEGEAAKPPKAPKQTLGEAIGEMIVQELERDAKIVAAGGGQ